MDYFVVACLSDLRGSLRTAAADLYVADSRRRYRGRRYADGLQIRSDNARSRAGRQRFFSMRQLFRVENRSGTCERSEKRRISQSQQFR